MIGFIYLLSLTNVISIALLVALYQKNQKLKATLNARPESVELQEFLLDLMTGTSLVKISRVDSTNIVLRTKNR